MTQRILVGIGIFVVVTLLLLWGYLLLFGTPNNINSVFTDLGIIGQPTEIQTETNSGNTQLADNQNQLRQLTTKVVAGFVYLPKIEASTTTPEKPERIRYVERGTGHVYEINLDNNSESRISGNTTGKTVNAIFNLSGELVVLESEQVTDIIPTIVALGGNTVKSTKLPINSSNFSFNNIGDIRYTTIENNQTFARQYDWQENLTQDLWTTPMTEIEVFWSDNKTYLTNKNSPWFKGGVYEIINGNTQRINQKNLYSFSAVIDKSGNNILYSGFDTDRQKITNAIQNIENNSLANASVLAVPEKCTHSELTGFICALSSQINDGNRESLSKWYKGEITSSDTLWQQNTDGSAKILSYLPNLAGFDIDVIKLFVTEDGKKLLFLNKTNNSLWLYNLGL